MQNLAVSNSSAITETIDYWADEKYKLLRGASAHAGLKRKKVISRLLPRWERQKQKRLERVQTLLDGGK
ncbi:MAG TPA: hypothetical protein VF268_10390 [Gammaproteobacteria bacterium]